MIVSVATNKMQLRLYSFDIIKFLLMIGVIAGHASGNGLVEPFDKYGISSNILDNLIVGVSMPLFFVISGYFTLTTFIKSDIAKIVARVLGFVWPLFAFGVVFAIVGLVDGSIPMWKVPLYPFVRVMFGGWFLRTLAIVYVIVAVVWRLCKSDRIRYAVMGVLYLLFVVCPKTGLMCFWVSYTMHMLPYFVFGLWLKQHSLFWKNAIVAIGCGAIFFAIVLLEGSVANNGMGFYWVSSEWRDMILNTHGLVCFFGRTIVGITGSVFFIWAFDRLIKLWPKLGIFGQFGTSSLGVYVIHEWPLVELGKFHAFSIPGAWKWPLVLFVFFICHYVIVGIKKAPTLKFLFFGDEEWTKRMIMSAWRRTAR